MATLLDLRTSVARKLRDASFTTFTTTEIDELVNQGIDAIGSVYPREISQTIGTVASGVQTYSVSSFTNISRVDIHTSAGSYRAELPHAFEGRDTGWEVHAGILYLPPSWTLTAGDTLRAFGYGGYTQLAASTSTTDLDTSAQYAVMVFAMAEAYDILLADRGKFEQWQADPSNTDTDVVKLNQLAHLMSRRWHEERQRLRKIRKL